MLIFNPDYALENLLGAEISSKQKALPLFSFAMVVKCLHRKSVCFIGLSTLLTIPTA
jgi:hypothetical protein